MGVTESKRFMCQESYVKAEKPSQRNPDVRTIPQCLEYYARTVPDKEAAVFISTDGEREAVTFKEVYEKSKTVAHNLLSLGVKRHEVVAINLRNCLEWLYIAFGSMMAGIRPLSVRFAYKDEGYLVELFERLNCCSMVMDRGYEDENWNIFSKLLDSYSSDGKAASTSLPSLRYLIGYSDCITGAKSLDEMVRDHVSHTSLPVIKEDDIAILLQSSGSTGLPKIITHNHRSLMTFVDAEQGPAFHSDGIHFNDRPFGWIAGFPLSLLIGQTRVTPYGMCPPPKNKTNSLIDIIQQERCHSATALPITLQEILKQKNQLTENWPLETIITGGQPIPKQSLSSIGTICNYILIVYGSSESVWSTVNVVSDPSKFIEHNCGRLSTGKEMKIVDDDGITVPVGVSGEIYMRGTCMFLEYYNDHEQNKQAFTEDGWFKTEDVGRLAADGCLMVEGRLSNKINAGGFHVSPEMMESLLRSCPGVESVVVVPVPDTVQYQAVCACVKVLPGSNVNETVLQNFCEDVHGDKQRIFTVLPKYYMILESFPQTSTGKVSRKDLEAIAKDKFVK